MSIVDPPYGELRQRGQRLFSSQVIEARRFFQGPPQRGSGNIVVSGGFERVEPDYAVKHRRFPFLCVEFVVGGKGEAKLTSGRFKLGMGTIFSYLPHTMHSIATDTQHPLAKYFVTTAGPAGKQLLKRLGFETGTAWQSSRPGDLQRLFDELLVHGVRADSASRAICDRLAEVILQLCMSSRLAPGTNSGAGFETYERCCRVLDTQAMKTQSLDDMAKLCGVSPEYLCRLFKRFEDQSPYQRLVHARMNIAAARLRNGNVLVKDLAREMGYADAFHFSRVFKRVFGYAPAAMRGHLIPR